MTCCAACCLEATTCCFIVKKDTLLGYVRTNPCQPQIIRSLVSLVYDFRDVYALGAMMMRCHIMQEVQGAGGASVSQTRFRPCFHSTLFVVPLAPYEPFRSPVAQLRGPDLLHPRNLDSASLAGGDLAYSTRTSIA